MPVTLNEANAPTKPSFANRFFDSVLSAPSWQHLVFVLLVTILKYGGGLFPSLSRMLSFAQNWRHPEASVLLQGQATYLLSSPVQNVIAGIIHCTSFRSYFLFSEVCIFLALGLGYAFTTIRRSPEARLCYTMLVLSGALAPVMLNWTGSYDPVSIMSGSTAILARSKWLRAFGWAVFAFNNAPEAAIALIVVGLVALRQDGKHALRAHLIDAFALICGVVGITVLVHIWGVSSSGSFFSYIADRSYSTYIDPLFSYFPLIIFSGLGVGWIMLTSPRIRGERGTGMFVGCALATSVLVPLIAADQTRLIVGALWPGLLFIVFAKVTTWATADLLDWLRKYFYLVLFVPVLTIWAGGGIEYAGLRQFFEMIRYVAHV